MFRFPGRDAQAMLRAHFVALRAQGLGVSFPSTKAATATRLSHGEALRSIQTLRHGCRTVGLSATMSPMRHAVSCVPTHGFWLVVDGLLKSNFVHCLRLDGLISVSQSKHRLLQFLLFVRFHSSLSCCGVRSTSSFRRVCAQA